MLVFRRRSAVGILLAVAMLAATTATASAFPGPTVTADTTVTRVAGVVSAPGFSGDGGPAVDAELAIPYEMAVDDDGNLFIADSGVSRVRKVDVATGVITTVAGNGTDATTGDGGPATAASLNGIFGIAYHDGKLAISTNDVIREVDLDSGTISTIAGTAGAPGNAGDGGLATAAQVVQSQALAYDAAGNLYLVADSAVRRIAASNGIITTYAGDAATNGFAGDGGPRLAARFGFIADLAFDNSGDLIVSDVDNNRVRKIDTTSGVVSTIAGDGTAGVPVDGANATSTPLGQPLSLAIDGKNNLYVSNGLGAQVFRLDAATETLRRVAGDPGSALTVDGTLATDFEFGITAGLALGDQGILYISTFWVSTVVAIQTPDTEPPMATIAAPDVVQRFGPNGSSWSVSCVDAVDPEPSCFPTLDGGSIPTKLPTNRLTGGTISLFSTDAAGNTASDIHTYTMDWKVYGTYEGASGDAGTVVRFYIATFGRLPDAEGFGFWTGRLSGDPAAIADVAAFFTTSTEFELLYGTSVTDEEFIDTIYGNVLGRNPDAPGRAFWAERISSGEMTRGQIMEFFAQSPEHKIITATS